MAAVPIMVKTTRRERFMVWLLSQWMIDSRSFAADHASKSFARSKFHQSLETPAPAAQTKTPPFAAGFSRGGASLAVRRET
jgi:hypothetical protein